MKIGALVDRATRWSSRRATIPGNEKAIHRIKNQLVARGVADHRRPRPLVHVSGHPRRDELREMYGWTRPQIAVPVHGEAMHLAAHAARRASSASPQVAQVRDGDMLRLAPGAGRDHRRGAGRAGSTRTAR